MIFFPTTLTKVKAGYVIGDIEGRLSNVDIFELIQDERLMGRSRTYMKCLCGCLFG